MVSVFVNVSRRKRRLLDVGCSAYDAPKKLYFDVNFPDTKLAYNEKVTGKNTLIRANMYPACIHDPDYATNIIRRRYIS